MDVLLSWILNSYEMGEKRQKLRFKYYYVSAYHRVGGKENLFREGRGENRTV